MPHTCGTVSARAGDLSPTEEEISEAIRGARFGIAVPDAPPCAQAASLAGMLLRTTRQPTWPALAQAIEDGDEDTLVRLADLELTAGQEELLDTWAAVIEVAVVEPGGTVCVCSGCGDWSVIGSRAAPSGCRTTSGCTGKVVKAPRATRRRLDTSEQTRPPPRDDRQATELAAVIPLFGPDEPAGPAAGQGTQADGTAATGVPAGVGEWTVDPEETFGEAAGQPDPGLRGADETVEAGDFAL